MFKIYVFIYICPNICIYIYVFKYMCVSLLEQAKCINLNIFLSDNHDINCSILSNVIIFSKSRFE